MGFGGISLWQLIIILVIVLLLFGTKKLRNLGADLGGALKGFRNAMKEDAEDEQKSGSAQAKIADEDQGNTFDVKAEKVDDSADSAARRKDA